MVNLERNPAYTGHNIPVDPGNYYRGVNAASYEDLWSPDETGADVMQGHGKGGTDRLSFQAGYPNDLYVNGLVRANMIIEGTEAMGIEEQTPDGYSYVRRLERANVESGETPLRVYMRRPIGNLALHAVHNWDIVFDSFPDNSDRSGSS